MSSSLNPSIEKIGDFRSCERTEKSRINSSSVTSLRSVSFTSRTAMMHLRREPSKQLACLRFAEDRDVSAADYRTRAAALDGDGGTRRNTDAHSHVRERHQPPKHCVVLGVEPGLHDRVPEPAEGREGGGGGAHVASVRSERRCARANGCDHGAV